MMDDDRAVWKVVMIRQRGIPTTLPLALAVGLLPLLLSAGCGDGKSEVRSQVPRNVRVLELAETDFQEYFEVAGMVQPVRGTDVSSEEEGSVAVIHHDRGAQVAAGAVLLELDRRLLAAGMESSRAALKQQAFNLEKSRQLYQAQKISEFELLTTETQYAQTKATKETAEIRHDRAAIKAPFAGIVTDRYVELGQLVTPGLPVARVVDPYTLKLVGTVTEREVAWVRPGAEAVVRLDGVEHPVRGRVHWVGFEADPRTGKFRLEINIANPDLALRSGVVGRARLVKKDHGRQLVIPRDSLLGAGVGEYVFVAQGDTAAIRPVTLGADQGLLVVVTAGLRAGDKVVVRGQRDLVEGAKVVIQEESNSSDGSLAADPTAVKAPSSRLPALQDREGGE